MNAPKQWGSGLSEQAVSYQSKDKDQEFSRMEFRSNIAVNLKEKPKEKEVVEIEQVNVIENAFSCEVTKPLPWGTGS